MPIAPDLALSNLGQIRIRVRKLTKSPSVVQLSDADIDTYINNFVLYDIPEELRMFYLRSTFSFYTKPFIDTYSTEPTAIDDPFYNFKNQYITAHGPMYIGGMPAFFTQSREQFYNIYPKVSSIASIGVYGNGVTTNFAGVLSSIPVLRNEVLFSSVDLNNNALALIDDGNGNLVVPNSTVTIPASTINYLTGAYVLNFPTAPGNGVAINSQTFTYMPNRPQGICYYQGSFILRPVPDQPYKVNLEVYKRPTEMLTYGQLPELAEWAQYISFGASIKVCIEDRLDPDTVQILMPFFKKYETLIMRRTLVQQSNERTATIYTEQTGVGAGYSFGGSNF